MSSATGASAPTMSVHPSTPGYCALLILLTGAFGVAASLARELLCRAHRHCLTSWKGTDRVCGKRLRALIPAFVEALLLTLSPNWASCLRQRRPTMSVRSDGPCGASEWRDYTPTYAAAALNWAGKLPDRARVSVAVATDVDAYTSQGSC
jgi:hypothetical protein